jgi:hypothetical protein
MDPQSLYMQLGDLVRTMPDLRAPGPLSPETLRWLGRAHMLVAATGDTVDIAGLKVAADALIIASDISAPKIENIVYRAASTILTPSKASAGFRIGSLSRFAWGLLCRHLALGSASATQKHDDCAEVARHDRVDRAQPRH